MKDLHLQHGRCNRTLCGLDSPGPQNNPATAHGDGLSPVAGVRSLSGYLRPRLCGGAATLPPCAVAGLYGRGDPGVNLALLRV